MHGIADRVALITGAGSGIGQASAKRFAEEGANVVVVDIDEEAGKSTVESIVNQGGDATFVAADVSDPAQVEAMVDTAIDTYGKLDFVHNNAGFAPERIPIDQKKESSYDAVTDVNLKGIWLGIKHSIPKLIETEGAIVNTASIVGLEGASGLSFYSAAKHGVVGLTKTAALEYAEQGIRVNAVCPGGLVNTEAVKEYQKEYPEKVQETIDATPMDRIAEPAEIASAVVWLCSEDASFITGHPLVIDGGNSA
jgi:NAD(P)-dependent dehydrogenase (short-subunit alcohol dehydrogenase family)